MNKKTLPLIIGVATGIGIVLALAYFLLNGHKPGEIAGICLGFVTGIFGAIAAMLLARRSAAKNPETARAKNIAEKDERNTAIREKAGASANRLLFYILPAVALAFVLLDVELAAILTMCGLVLLQAILTVFFHYYYEKKM